MIRPRVWCLVLLLALPVSAQVSETVTVNVVEVPVTVVDRAGQAVKGLTKNDFELYVDGKKVTVTGFDTVDIATVDQQPLTRPVPTVAYRNFLLLFDLSASSPGTIGRAQAAASEFIEKHMKRSDRTAVAMFSVEKGPRILTGFTSDRELLRHVIENVVAPELIKVPDPFLLAAPPKVDVAPQTSTGSNRNAREEAELRREALREVIGQHNRVASAFHQQDLRARLRKELVDLGALARLLDRLPGQKQIILLSEGFDPAIVQGRGSLTERATQEENEAVDRGEVWKVTSEKRFGSSASSAEIQAMADLFRRSDVRLHAIDIKGLRSDVDAFVGVRESSNEGLYLMTRPTGGSVFENATNLSRNFEELVRQQEVVYVLAFEARRTFTPGAFHEIRVRVPAAKGGRVTHRAGFYETSATPDTPFEQTFALAALLMTDEERKDIPLSFTAAPLPMDENVPVVVELPGEALIKGDGESVLTADLYVYAFDASGHVRDYLQQRLAVDLARHGDRLRSGGMLYLSSMRLPPGRYTVKTLVHVEESGRIGLTRRTIDVPGEGISAAFLRPVQNGINVAAPGRSDQAVDAFRSGERRFVPVSSPTLREPTTIALHRGTPKEGFPLPAARFLPPHGALGPILRVLEESEERLLVELDPSELLPGQYTLVLDGAPPLPFRVE